MKNHYYLVILIGLCFFIMGVIGSENIRDIEPNASSICLLGFVIIIIGGVGVGLDNRISKIEKRFLMGEYDEQSRDRA